MQTRIKSFLVPLFFIFIFSPAQLSHADPAEEIASIHFVPGMSVPLGPDASTYTLGGGGNLLARFTFPGLSFLSFEGGVGFTMAPLKVAAGMPVSSSLLWTGAARLGIGAYFPLLRYFVAGAYVHGGYYLGGFISNPPDSTTGSDPMLDAGLELDFMLSPYMSLGAGACYRMLFGLSNDLLVNLGVSYHFPLAKGGPGPESKPYPQLKLLNARLGDVFPVFYAYYGDHPVGSLEIQNNGKIPLENVNVTVFVNQYMDNPYACKTFEFIKGGARERVDLFALFNDKVLGITENTKVQINIKVESMVAGEKYSNELIGDLRVYDRNAMTWDDDRHAAAFVSMKDPSVLKFSKNVTSFIKDKASKAINKNFLTGLACFETMKLYGMSYAVDPTTPFTEFSKSKTAVDFLQFPGQTLEYKAGDCDDLSILYSALLESVGIETAFITVPGHIYVAFSLGLTPEEAQKQLPSSNDLILRDDIAWLPVEVTALSGGFLYAWQAGIKLWKEQEPLGQAKLIVVQEAWKTYPPVGENTPHNLTLPDESRVVSAYLQQVMKYIDRDLYPQTQKIEEQLKTQPGNARLLNKLGVLYARYGVYDKAEAAFNRVPNKESSAPTLVNLGNLAYVKNDLAQAREYFEKAFAKEPNDIAVLVDLAKLAYEQGRYSDVGTYYSRLENVNKDIADKYSYLALKGSDSETRAARADAMKDQFEWGE
jgi:tetratricopeptide (TPR) repeat protein